MNGLLAVLLLLSPPGGARARVGPKPVKVFVLAGQSNMEGKAKVALLEYQAQQPATRDLFKHLRQGDRWIERDDVWIKFLDRKGNLTVGYGSPKCIGPGLRPRDGSQGIVRSAGGIFCMEGIIHLMN